MLIMSNILNEACISASESCLMPLGGSQTGHLFILEPPPPPQGPDLVLKEEMEEEHPPFAQ